MAVGLTAAWGHAMYALIRSGEWDVIESLAYPVVKEHTTDRLCIEAHRNPSLYPELREKLAEEKANNRYIDRFAYCWALTGDIGEAFETLDAVLEIDPTDIRMMWSRNDAIVEMRRSPRFRQVLRDIGLVDLYKVRGWPDDCRAAGAQDFVCD